MIRRARIIPDLSKIQLFLGHNFNRCQAKVKFIINTNKIEHVLTSLPPSNKIENYDNNTNKICKIIILSTLLYELFDVYYKIEYASRIWNVLEKKYMLKNA